MSAELYSNYLKEKQLIFAHLFMHRRTELWRLAEEIYAVKS